MKPSEFKIRKDDLKRRVRRLLERGVTNRKELANAHQLQPGQVRQLVAEIQQDIHDETLEDANEQRELRTAQLMHVGRMALNEFERSRMDSEEFAIAEELCPLCRGRQVRVEKDDDGDEYEVDCARCDGKGVVQRTTTRVKTKPGDPAYLRVYSEIVQAAAKLNGLYPGNGNVVVGRRLTKVAGEVGGAIEQEVKEMYIECSSDTVIKALAIIEEIEEELAEGKARVIDQPPPLRIEEKNNGDTGT